MYILGQLLLTAYIDKHTHIHTSGQFLSLSLHVVGNQITQRKPRQTKWGEVHTERPMCHPLNNILILPDSCVTLRTCWSSFLKYLLGAFWSISRCLDTWVTCTHGTSAQFCVQRFCSIVETEHAWTETERSLTGSENLWALKAEWEPLSTVSQPLPVKTALADCTTLWYREKAKHVQLVFTFHFLNVCPLCFWMRV